MKTPTVLIALLTIAAALPSLAADHEDTSSSTPAPVSEIKAAETPAMSEIPTMKEQGKRMATLMEQLSKESNPEIRRRIMAEAMCPQ